MAKKSLYINGTDYTAYTPEAGYTVTYEPVDGGQGGLMLSGEYTEDEIANKAVITVQLLPLTAAQTRTMIALLTNNVYLTVRYHDPRANALRTITARRQITPITFRGTGGTGVEYWTGLQITFRER